MFAVLLLAVGVAWWISQTRGGGGDQALAVLKDIRSQGLGAFWGDQPNYAWYLATKADGEMVGWRVNLRMPLPNEAGYVGISHQRGIDEQGKWQISEERWQLDPTAQMGSYEARVGRGRRIEPQLFINFDKGLLTVSVPTHSDKQAAPANYLPEGLLPLAIRLTHQSGKKASFGMIINEVAIHELAAKKGQLHVVPLAITPQADGVLLNYASAFEVHVTLDEQGEIQAEEAGGSGIRWQRATPEQVVKQFPEAGGYLPKQDDVLPGNLEREPEDISPDEPVLAI